MTRQKISKEIENLNNTINKPQLIDIYRNIPPNNTRTHIISGAHRTFSRTDYMLDNRTNLNKFKRVEIYQICFLTTMEFN